MCCLNCVFLWSLIVVSILIISSLIIYNIKKFQFLSNSLRGLCHQIPCLSFALSIVLGICFGVLITIIFCGYLTLDSLFDFVAIFFGLILILIISCITYSINEKAAWVPITLIIAVGIMTFFLVELDLDEGGVLVNKLSLGGVCEISCRNSFKNEIDFFCKNVVCGENCNLKKKIKANFPSNWEPSFNSAYEKLAGDKEELKDLLELCCAKNPHCLIKKLKDITRSRMEMLDKNIDNNEAKIELAKILILENLILEAFSKAVTHCQCSKSASCDCESDANLKKELELKYKLEEFK